MVRLLGIQLSEPIHYLLELEASPTFYKIGQGVQLLNPILRQAHLGDSATHPTRMPCGRIWFSSAMITIADILRSDDSDPPEIMRLIGPPLQNLRIVSRQAGISRRYLSVSRWDPDSLSTDMLDYEQPDYNLRRIVINGTFYSTAVTCDHLATLASDSLVSYTHESHFVDAIAAYSAQDFRSCLIYAAFSLEAAAGRWLKDRYAAALIARPTHLRVRTVQSNQQAAPHAKDDIWEHLDNDARDICRQMFHLRPMYLERRSLLIENETLYLRLKRLFSTRNAIVHSELKPETYPIDEASCGEVLGTVIEVLKWLAFPADFVIPGEMLDVTPNGVIPRKTR